MVRVAHLTSVHGHSDTRIFFKECATLAAARYEVHLVAPGAPTTVHDNVHVHGVPRRRRRFARMTATTRAVYATARAIDAAVYHFHDPELIPVGLALKALGKRVIYDMHEDVPRQIMDKQWIARRFRRVVSLSVDRLQTLACRAFDAVILAESLYLDRVSRSYSSEQAKYVVVRNYPLVGELSRPSAGWAMRPRAICYIGGVTRLRGATQMVQAAERSDAKLLLGGPIESEALLRQLQATSGWKNVEYLGVLDRSSVASTLTNSMAGLVVLHPVPNYMVSEPTKLFEYMSAGIPVISSNFPLWSAIVEGCRSGLCVDPLNPDAIAKAIRDILGNRDDARRMGENGRKAVEEKYNWEAEGKKLVELYKTLLG